MTAVTSRIRFVTAIGLAVILGVWLAWTSLGGALETYADPADVAAGTTYRLNGLVAPGAPADAAERAQTAAGLRFAVTDKHAAGEQVKVVYHGSVPDQFKVGREVVITGELDAAGTFVGRRNSLVTLCPSKFSDDPTDHRPPTPEPAAAAAT